MHIAEYYTTGWQHITCQNTAKIFVGLHAYFCICQWPFLSWDETYDNFSLITDTYPDDAERKIVSPLDPTTFTNITLLSFSVYLSRRKSFVMQMIHYHPRRISLLCVSLVPCPIHPPKIPKKLLATDQPEKQSMQNIFPQQNI